MGKRIDLHNKLKEVTAIDNVYFQPPEGLQMNYPAIRYSKSNIQNEFADDEVYTQTNFYDIVVIDEDPDSEISEKISRMKGCRFVRHYAADGLNHDIYTLYY